MNGASGSQTQIMKSSSHTTIGGTHKLVCPFFVIGINHKNVATAPSHVSSVVPDATIRMHSDNLLSLCGWALGFRLLLDGALNAFAMVFGTPQLLVGVPYAAVLGFFPLLAQVPAAFGVLLGACDS